MREATFFLIIAAVTLTVAHLSDLHVSRFGEHVTSLATRALHGRLAKQRVDWEPVREVDGWSIERRGKDVRLLDDLGIVQASRKGETGGAEEAITSLEALVEERHRTEHRRLAQRMPGPDEVERLLVDDPGNTNLLFCRAAHAVRADRPDWVLLSGDLTDDGIGYDLISGALAPFVDAGRVLAVPGNHDVYDSPYLVVPKHARKSRTLKRKLWAAFAERLGLPVEGAWLRDLGDGVVLAGLDSCHPARAPFSASGLVTPEDLADLAEKLAGVPEDAVRLGMLHHHVVNPPLRSVGFQPWNLGMRLRNARTVFDFFCKHEFDLVMNGHRHVGYRYHPAHAPMFVAAPSATLGCRSRQSPRPFYWKITVDGGEVASVRERPL